MCFFLLLCRYELNPRIARLHKTRVREILVDTTQMDCFLFLFFFRSFFWCMLRAPHKHCFLFFLVIISASPSYLTLWTKYHNIDDEFYVYGRDENNIIFINFIRKNTHNQINQQQFYGKFLDSRAHKYTHMQSINLLFGETE